jgi:hypothetical protein
MRSKLAWLIVGLIVGVLVWYFLPSIPVLGPLLNKSYTEQDRPPIIVQEGSFQYKIDDATVKWKEKGTSGGKKWRIEQRNPRSVTGFSVTVTGTNCPSLPDGQSASVTFESGSTYVFNVISERDSANKNEPIADAPTPLTHDGAQLLTFGTPGSGNITKLTIDGTDVCSFNAAAAPVIKFTFKHQ